MKRFVSLFLTLCLLLQAAPWACAVDPAAEEPVISAPAAEEPVPEPAAEELPAAEEEAPAAELLEDLAYSGTFGNGFTWELDLAAGTFTFTGTGAMPDYTYHSDTPWYKTMWTHKSEPFHVIFGEGITHIGSQTCAWTYHVTNITFPSTLESIGAGAFGWQSGMTKLTIPASVTQIGDGAFSWIKVLEELVILNPDTVYGTGVFATCGHADDALGLKVTLPEGMTKIPEGFLRESNVIQINIPSTVTVIEDYAFRYCDALTSVALPDGLVSIGYEAFSMCPLTPDFTLPDSLQTIGGYAFQHCQGYSVTDWPTQLQSIGAYAFDGCGFGTLTIPENVTIGDRAFAAMGRTTDDGLHLDVLTQVTLPSDDTLLGKCVLGYNEALASVTIPDTWKSIPHTLFENCDGLTEVHLPEGLTVLKEGAFRYCEGLKTLRLPGTVKTIEKYVFQRCTALTWIGLPDGLETIGASAFKECSALTQISIPNSVTKINGNAFESCTALTEFIFPPNAVTGYSVLANCTGITSVTLPKAMTKIPIGLLENTGLTSFTIPEGIVELESGIFQSCSKLKSVTFPASVTTIGSGIFYKSSASSAVFLGGPPTVGAATDRSAAFNSDTILYYLASNADLGWTSPTWQGYQTRAILSADGAFEAHGGEYYASLPNRLFQFTDSTEQPLTGATLHFGEAELPLGDASEVSVAMDDSAATVRFSHADCHSAALPVRMLSTINQVQLHPTTQTGAFIQSVYATRDTTGNSGWVDMVHGGMTFRSTDSTELTQFYIDVNWNSQAEGQVYLAQSLDPENGVLLQDGFNDAQALSQSLIPGRPLLILAVTADGQVSAKTLKATVTRPEINMEFLIAADQAPVTDNSNELFSKFEFGLKLPTLGKAELAFHNDGTFKGVIGLDLKDEDDAKIFEYSETVKEALEDRELSDVMGFFKRNGLDVSADKLTILIESQVRLLGYVEGFVSDDGELLFTEVAVGLVAENKLSNTWQFVTGPVPFYIRTELSLDGELKVILSKGDMEPLNSVLEPDSLQAELKFPLTAAAGVGADKILSAGVYGKVETVLGFKLPAAADNGTYAYASGEIGVEAQALGIFETKFNIFEQKKEYFWGEANAASLLTADLSAAQWTTMGRDYLDAVSLLAVDGSNTEQTVSTISTVYPAAAVQTAPLSDGSLLAVWTDDPGREVRTDANRTMLYYSIGSGSIWSQPLPVEAADDGTADANPVLHCLNGTVYLVWQDAASPFTADDGISDAAAKLDLSCAVFDEAAGSFTVLGGSFGSNSYDGAASITELNGQPIVCFAANPENDPVSMTGSGSLYRAAWSGEAWTTTRLTDCAAPVDATTAYGEQLWYSCGGEIYTWNNGAVNLTNNDILETKPFYANGQILWYADGSLVRGNETIPLAQSTDRYQYLRSSAGLEAVVYAVTGEDRLTSLYASFNDGTGWGQPMELAGGRNHIGSFHGSFLADGSLAIAAREQPVLEELTLAETASLQVYTLTPAANLTVNDATYMSHTLLAGKNLDLQVTLTNSGAAAIPLVSIDVTGVTLDNNVYQVELLPGESTTVYLSALLPTAVPDSLTVTVTPMGLSDTMEDNAVTVSLRQKDVSVEDTVVSWDGSTAKVLTTVANRGQQTLQNIVLTLSDQNGAALQTETIAGPLAAGENIFHCFTVENAAEGSVLTVTAADQGDENLTTNNSRTIPVPSKPATGFTEKPIITASEDAVSVLVTVQNPTNAAVTRTYVCAAYDENGQMLACFTEENYTAAAGQTSYVDFSLPKDTAKVRLFRLNGDYAPLDTVLEKDIVQ